MINRGDDPQKAKERLIHDREKFSFDKMSSIDEIINTSVFSINYLSELVYKTYQKLLNSKKEG